MALEKTTLNKETIIELIKQNYGLQILAVQKMKLGTANCYRLHTINHDYFLKEFQSKICTDDLIREAKLVDYLTHADFLTAHFIKTTSGDVFFDYENHLIYLQEYTLRENEYW